VRSPDERYAPALPIGPAAQVVNVKRFGKSYVLYQCGTPDPSTLPAGAVEGVTPGMRSFEIPLFSVAVTDTTVNGFLVRGGGSQSRPLPRSREPSRAAAAAARA
jgi:hypothetical protein